MSVKIRVSATPNSVVGNAKVQHQWYRSVSLARYPASSMSPQCWPRFLTTSSVLTLCVVRKRSVIWSTIQSCDFLSPEWVVVYYESIKRELQIKPFVVYYESIKRELKIKPIYECRCDGRGCMICWILILWNKKKVISEKKKFVARNLKTFFYLGNFTYIFMLPLIIQLEI